MTGRRRRPLGDDSPRVHNVRSRDNGVSVLILVVRSSWAVYDTGRDLSKMLRGPGSRREVSTFPEPHSATRVAHPGQLSTMRVSSPKCFRLAKETPENVVPKSIPTARPPVSAGTLSETVFISGCIEPFPEGGNASFSVGVVSSRTPLEIGRAHV